MILSFQVSNYRSYREANTLHFTDGKFKKNQPKPKGWEEVTYRATGLFGANGAGKSNILHALMGLKLAVAGSLKDPKHVRRLRSDHFANNHQEPTTFLIDYVSQQVRYRWQLELTSDGIDFEALQANVNGPWRLVFAREGSEIKFGPSAEIPRSAQENISQFLHPWVLVFSAWSTVKSPGAYAPALKWWEKALIEVPHGEESQDHRHDWVLQLVKEPSWLNLLKEVSKAADVGIIDVKINEQDAPRELLELLKKIESAVKGNSNAQDGLILDNEEHVRLLARYLEFTHKGSDGAFSLPEHLQSVGTRAWIDIAIPALFVIIHGGVLVVDEIDGSLHSGLVRELISYFTDPSINTLGAQLIFSSHDLSLLGNHPEPALEREATWFVEKVDGASELFSLNEFKLRDTHNGEKRYLQGAFGALPAPTSAGLRALVWRHQSASHSIVDEEE